uniref:hypothetical protein n=1 Tax=Actinokineospora sp. CA-119265 TaxID=3239890 RepID=UPI003F49A7CB
MAAVMTVLPGDVLVDAGVRTVLGDTEIAAVPALRLGELRVYPRPCVRHDEAGGASAIVLDLRCWLISVPGGAVPLECTSSTAAVRAAEVLRKDIGRQATSYNAAELAHWAAWWCGCNSDAVLLDGARVETGFDFDNEVPR